jgi:hypothetical protein
LNGVVAFESNVDQLVNDVLIHVLFVEGNGHFGREVGLGHWFASFSRPWVFPDLVQRCSLLGIDDEHPTNQVTALQGHVIRHDVLSVDDLGEELLEGVPVKWQRSAHQDVEEDAH